MIFDAEKLAFAILNLKHPALTSGRNGVRSTLLFSNLLKHSKFQAFFKILVFQILKMIFHSYEFFGSGNRYYSRPRSLHLCFRSVLKFSKFLEFLHFSSKKYYFRKNFATFRRANNYSNADSKGHLLPQK